MTDINLKTQLKSLPTAPGVYIFRDENGGELYIGKSMRLRERVRSYFHASIELGERTARMVGKIASINHIQTETELEALLLEADLIKRLKPRYNIQWKDDKRYKYIEIVNHKSKILNQEQAGQKGKYAWPYVTTSRKQNNPNSLYFGPFPEGRTVNRVLKTLRKIFPWCKYENEAALKRAGCPCFYYHINQCPGICAGTGKISVQEYWAIINDLIEFLRGNKKDLIAKYCQAMQKAAERQDFERAARFRDKLQQLEYITQQFRDSSEYIENPNLIQDIRTQEIEELRRVILSASEESLSEQRESQTGTEARGPSSASPPQDDKQFRIEAYDISNLGPNHTVGSRVVFVGGEPNKAQYRRYKIRLKDTPNDVAAMKEILFRRFKHLSDNHSAIQPANHLPDLLLIDGGKGQVNAAQKVLAEKQLDIPIVGLAKKNEELIIPHHNSKKQETFLFLRLPKASPALQLLQRVRDEAHRFAQSYHKHLRRKELTHH